jgi:hypothetical protein
MPVSEKSKANLEKRVKFTSDSANVARLKGLMKRRNNSELVKLIDKNYATILNILSSTSDEELSKAIDEWKDMPVMLKAYLVDASDPTKTRFVLEQIIDRVKGKPKQSEEVQVSGSVNYRFKFGDE